MPTGKYAKEAVEKVQAILDNARQSLRAEAEKKIEALPRDSAEAKAAYDQYIADDQEITTAVYDLFVAR